MVTILYTKRHFISCESSCFLKDVNLKLGQSKRRGFEEELLGIDRVEAHSTQNAAVL